MNDPVDEALAALRPYYTIDCRPPNRSTLARHIANLGHPIVVFGETGNYLIELDEAGRLVAERVKVNG